MTKKPHLQFWNKKQGRAASTNAVARHAGTQAGRLSDEVKADMTRAQFFMQNLKEEIRKAV